MWMYTALHVHALLSLLEMSSIEFLTVSTELESCRNVCGAVNISPVWCSCDKNCSTYGDCCAGYFLFCTRSYKTFEGRNSTSDWRWEDNVKLFKSRDLVPQIRCLVRRNQHVTVPRVLAVSTCPENHTGEDFCENPKPYNIKHLVPFYDSSTNRVYRNRYCALCNGAVSSLNMIPFDVSVSCSQPANMSYLRHDGDIRAFNSCTFTISRPSEVRSDERCRLVSEQYVNTCHQVRQGFSADALCHAFYSPVSTNISILHGYWKNRECKTCGTEMLRINPSLNASSLLIPAGSYEPGVTVPVALTASTVHIAHTAATTKATPESCNHYQYTFHMLFDFVDDYPVKSTDSPQSQSSYPQVVHEHNDHLHQRKNLTLNLTVGIIALSEYSLKAVLDALNSSSFDYIRDDETTECSSSEVAISYKMMTSVPVLVTSLMKDIQDLLRYGMTNDLISISLYYTDQTSPECNNEMLEIREFKSRYTNGPEVEHLWEENQTISFSWRRALCQTGDFLTVEHKCVRHLHNPLGCSLFNISGDVQQMKRKEFDLSSFELSVQSNINFVSLCISTIEDSFTDSTQALLGVIFIAISLASLLLTLITYAVIDKLRTTPSIYSLQLAACLLCSHVLYLLLVSRDVRVSTEGLCYCVAFFRHYILQVPFFLQAALAINIAWSFTHLWSKDSKDLRKRCWVCSTICWGVPLMIVTTAALLGHFSAIPVSILPENGCLIANKYLRVCLVGIPMATSTTISIVCFVISYLIIYKNNSLLKKMKAVSHRRRHLVTAIKISVLVGIPWILVLLGNIINTQLIRIVESVFNASQGSFLSITLLCNKTVFQECRKAFKTFRAGIHNKGVRRDKHTTTSS